MTILVNILILPVFRGPFFKGSKMGPKGPKKFFVCNDLENIIPLLNTFHLRYYMAFYVNIMILPVFGCPLF